jgi:hypothetical protein
MFLASGKLEEHNLSDYLTVQASLVAADKLYIMKKQVQTLSTYACRTHDSMSVGCDGSMKANVYSALLTQLISLSS